MDAMTDDALLELLAERAASETLHAAAQAYTLPRAAAEPIMLRDDERQRCEVWTRVMGYHRPVASFNIGKKGEHRERRFFTEAQARRECTG
jgi:hypothetical protein